MSSSNKPTKEELTITDRRQSEAADFLLGQITHQISDIRNRLEGHIIDEGTKFDAILAEVHTSHRNLTLALSSKIPQDTSSFWEVVTADLRAVKLVTVAFYFITALSIALYKTQTPVDDLHYLLTICPAGIWVALFAVMVTWRVSGLFWWAGNKLTHLVGPLLGIWLWGLVLVSSAVLTPVDDLEALTLIPLAIEVWILVRAFKEDRGRKWMQ